MADAEHCKSYDYLVSLKDGGFAWPLTRPSTKFRKRTSNLALLEVPCMVEPIHRNSGLAKLG